MDKYYTPAIEEFHIGFEHEDRQFRPVPTSMGIAKRRIFGPATLDTIKPFWQIEKDIEDGDIRVKYLDKEDIENLGFESLDVRFSKLIEPDRLRGITRTEVYISKLGEHHYKIIKFDHYKNSGGETILFSGIIKNKSELKRILKQLNI